VSSRRFAFDFIAGIDALGTRMVDAAGVYATVGEISDCLRGVFGEYREV
jgi:methylmalonyl-CoA mutase N-terminal domain/subunit